MIEPTGTGSPLEQLTQIRRQTLDRVLERLAAETGPRPALRSALTGWWRGMFPCAGVGLPDG